MTTITKEWLQKTITSIESARDEIPFGLDEDQSNMLTAFKIALASLELERGIIRRFDLDMSGCDSFGQDCGADMVEDLDGEYVLWDEVLPHLYRYGEYTATPAPVSVPISISDEDFEKALSVLNDTLDDCGDSERGLLLALDKAGIEVRSNASCAAMLQGADVSITHEGKNHHKDKLAMVDHSGDSNNMVEPVTTTYKLPFEQWLSKQAGTIDVECGCVMTEVFFNWLRVAYDAGNSPVIADGWISCSERMPNDAQWCVVNTEYGYYVQCWSEGQGWLGDDISIPECDVINWMPLPEPPQEVNRG